MAGKKTEKDKKLVKKLDKEEMKKIKGGIKTTGGSLYTAVPIKPGYIDPNGLPILQPASVSDPNGYIN